MIDAMGKGLWSLKEDTEFASLRAQQRERQKVSKANAKAKTAELAALAEQQGTKVWSREDRLAMCYRTTNSKGPNWNKVVRRQTFDLDTGELIKDEEGPALLQSQELQGPLPGAPRSIKTVLTYQSPTQAPSGVGA